MTTADQTRSGGIYVPAEVLDRARRMVEGSGWRRMLANWSDNKLGAGIMLMMIAGMLSGIGLGVTWAWQVTEICKAMAVHIPQDEALHRESREDRQALKITLARIEAHIEDWRSEPPRLAGLRPRSRKAK